MRLEPIRRPKSRRQGKTSRLARQDCIQRWKNLSSPRLWAGYIMIFYKVNSPEPAAKYFAKKIAGHLSKGRKILWLVTGGTNIKVAVSAGKLLKNQDLTNLTISLTDERYGPVGHPDSNWHQLKQAGFDLPGATMIPVLQGKDRI